MIKKINSIMQRVIGAHEEALINALEEESERANSGAAQEIAQYLQEYCGNAGVGVRVYAYDTQREDCLWHVVYKGRRVLGLGFYMMDKQTLERIKAFVAHTQHYGEYSK